MLKIDNIVGLHEKRTKIMNSVIDSNHIQMKWTNSFYLFAVIEWVRLDFIIPRTLTPTVGAHEIVFAPRMLLLSVWGDSFSYFFLLFFSFSRIQHKCFREKLHVKHEHTWDKVNHIFVAILFEQRHSICRTCECVILLYFFGLTNCEIWLSPNVVDSTHVCRRYNILFSSSFFFLVILQTDCGCDNCPVCFCFMQPAWASVIAPSIFAHTFSISLSLSVSDGLDLVYFHSICACAHWYAALTLTVQSEHIHSYACILGCALS